MKITVEMSLYPLQEDYKAVIIDFIKALNAATHVEVYTTAMSTYIVGDYENVMQLLTEKLKHVYEQIPASSTVIKIIPKDLEVQRGFIDL